MANEPLGESWQYHPEYHKMASFLGLDQHARQDYKVAQKLALIRDWAGLKGKKDDITDSLAVVDGVRKKIGTQAVGKTLIDQLYQHIRLDMDTQSRTPLRPNGTPQRKQEVKKKDTGIKGAVAQAVQSSIQNMVKSTLGDKKMLQKTIQTVVSESLK